MRFTFCSPLSLSLLSLLFLCSSVLAVPHPANDQGASPEDPPLPGRTDTSVDGNTVTGFWGDDRIPEHMRHKQDSLAEFPSNGDPVPYDPMGSRNRDKKLKGIAPAGTHPVTKEPRVLDETPLASQGHPNQDAQTTVRKLPHYESGGRRPLPQQEAFEARKEAWEKNNSGRTYAESSGPPARDGSLSTEAALTSRIQAQVEAINKKDRTKPARVAIRPNPGWLPLDPTQRRAHEAPGGLPNQKAPDPTNQPSNSRKRKGQNNDDTRPAKQQRLSDPSQPQQQTAAAPPRREGMRPRPDRQPVPQAAPKKPTPRPNSKPNADDPNGYLRPEPPIPQYKPGTQHRTSSTPEIGPPTNSANRVPPRPQNRESYNKNGLQKPNPPKPAPPPANHGAHEAPARLGGSSTPHTTLPPDQRVKRPLPAGWDKPINIPKPKASHGTPSQIPIRSAGSPGQPSPQKNAPSAPQQPVQKPPTAPASKPPTAPASKPPTAPASKPPASKIPTKSGKKGRRSPVLVMRLRR